MSTQNYAVGTYFDANVLYQLLQHFAEDTIDSQIPSVLYPLVTDKLGEQDFGVAITQELRDMVARGTQTIEKYLPLQQHVDSFFDYLESCGWKIAATAEPDRVTIDAYTAFTQDREDAYRLFEAQELNCVLGVTFDSEFKRARGYGKVPNFAAPIFLDPNEFVSFNFKAFSAMLQQVDDVERALADWTIGDILSNFTFPPKGVQTNDPRFANQPQVLFVTPQGQRALVQTKRPNGERTTVPSQTAADCAKETLKRLRRYEGKWPALVAVADELLNDPDWKQEFESELLNKKPEGAPDDWLQVESLTEVQATLLDTVEFQRYINDAEQVQHSHSPKPDQTKQPRPEEPFKIKFDPSYDATLSLEVLSSGAKVSISHYAGQNARQFKQVLFLDKTPQGVAAAVKKQIEEAKATIKKNFLTNRNAATSFLLYVPRHDQWDAAFINELEGILAHYLEIVIQQKDAKRPQRQAHAELANPYNLEKTIGPGFEQWVEDTFGEAAKDPLLAQAIAHFAVAGLEKATAGELNRHFQLGQKPGGDWSRTTQVLEVAMQKNGLVSSYQKHLKNNLGGGRNIFYTLEDLRQRIAKHLPERTTVPSQTVADVAATTTRPQRRTNPLLQAELGLNAPPLFAEALSLIALKNLDAITNTWLRDNLPLDHEGAKALLDYMQENFLVDGPKGYKYSANFTREDFLAIESDSLDSLVKKSNPSGTNHNRLLPAATAVVVKKRSSDKQQDITPEWLQETLNVSSEEANRCHTELCNTAILVEADGKHRVNLTTYGLKNRKWPDPTAKPKSQFEEEPAAVANQTPAVTERQQERSTKSTGYQKGRQVTGDYLEALAAFQKDHPSEDVTKVTDLIRREHDLARRRQEIDQMPAGIKKFEASANFNRDQEGLELLSRKLGTSASYVQLKETQPKFEQYGGPYAKQFKPTDFISMGVPESSLQKAVPAEAYSS